MTLSVAELTSMDLTDASLFQCDDPDTPKGSIRRQRSRRSLIPRTPSFHSLIVDQENEQESTTAVATPTMKNSSSTHQHLNQASSQGIVATPPIPTSTENHPTPSYIPQSISSRSLKSVLNQTAPAVTQSDRQHASTVHNSAHSSAHNQNLNPLTGKPKLRAVSSGTLKPRDSRELRESQMDSDRRKTMVDRRAPLSSIASKPAKPRTTVPMSVDPLSGRLKRVSLDKQPERGHSKTASTDIKASDNAEKRYSADRSTTADRSNRLSTAERAAVRTEREKEREQERERVRLEREKDRLEREKERFERERIRSERLHSERRVDRAASSDKSTVSTSSLSTSSSSHRYSMTRPRAAGSHSRQRSSGSAIGGSFDRGATSSTSTTTTDRDRDRASERSERAPTTSAGTERVSDRSERPERAATAGVTTRSKPTLSVSTSTSSMNKSTSISSLTSALSSAPTVPSTLSGSAGSIKPRTASLQTRQKPATEKRYMSHGSDKSKLAPLHIKPLISSGNPPQNFAGPFKYPRAVGGQMSGPMSGSMSGSMPASMSSPVRQEHGNGSPMGIPMNHGPPGGACGSPIHSLHGSPTSGSPMSGSPMSASMGMGMMGPPQMTGMSMGGPMAPPQMPQMPHSRGGSPHSPFHSPHHSPIHPHPHSFAHPSPFGASPHMPPPMPPPHRPMGYSLPGSPVRPGPPGGFDGHTSASPELRGASVDVDGCSRPLQSAEDARRMAQRAGAIPSPSLAANLTGSLRGKSYKPVGDNNATSSPLATCFPRSSVASPVCGVDEATVAAEMKKLTISKHDGPIESREKLQATLRIPSTVARLNGKCMTPSEAKARFPLIGFEKTEITSFKSIYYYYPFCNNHETASGTTDDPEGNLRLAAGDHIAYRYQVIKLLGKGSFGVVAQCYDHKTGAHVAVKIVKNKKRFQQQAAVEANFVQTLTDKDANDSYHIVKYRDRVLFRGHLCIVTELLFLNLYELIGFNKFRGLPLELVRHFAQQLLEGLAFLGSQNIVHCDLKPENILLSDYTKGSIKLIDFGSSCLENEKVYTYIQSRFYRSPEVILGADYNRAIDMWSFGCIIAELYTGMPIFSGENEQDQLVSIMEVLGFPQLRFLSRCSRRRLFFDTMGRPRPSILVSPKGKNRIPNTSSLEKVLGTSCPSFLSFLRACLQWDPDDRLTAKRALKHEFIVGVGR